MPRHVDARMHQSQRQENQRRYHSRTPKSKSICAQSVNQVDKKCGGAQQEPSVGGKPRRKGIADAERGEHQHHQEKNANVVSAAAKPHPP